MNPISASVKSVSVVPLFRRLPLSPQINSCNGACISADGSRIFMGGYSGLLNVSQDGGRSFSQYQPNVSWGKIVCSDDGSRLAAVDGVTGSPNVRLSSNGGNDWSSKLVSGSGTVLVSICSSADGMRLAVTTSNNTTLTGSIYTSSDGGASWTLRTSAGTRAFKGIASSSDGLYLATVVQSGYIYTSTDGGVTWTERVSGGARYWISIASSADGLRLLACSSGAPWLSTDGGANFVQKVGVSGYFAASSGDGMRLVVAPKVPALSNSDYIYTSLDGGLTWIKRIDLGVSGWLVALAKNSLVCIAYNNDIPYVKYKLF